MPATRGNANPASRAQAPKPSKKPRARARKQGRNRLNADDIPNETLPNEEARPNEEEVREEGGDMQLENAADTHDTTRALEALQGQLFYYELHNSLTSDCMQLPWLKHKRKKRHYRTNLMQRGRGALEGRKKV